VGPTSGENRTFWFVGPTILSSGISFLINLNREGFLPPPHCATSAAKSWLSDRA
jgi:hypothetical protein